MWVNNLDPVMFNIGPLEIRYYGLVYLLAALFGYLMLIHAQKKNKINLTKNDISDFVSWLVAGVLIGSRLFYIVFYNPLFYLENQLKIIAVWEGGMSFHGGFVGIIVAAYIFCKKKNQSFFHLADILSAPLMFALALGRGANFINGELWGKPSNLPWCVVFPAADNLCRHPYQLYEGIKRFALAGWLFYLSKGVHPTGFIFWNLVFFEGLGRFALDFLNDEFTVLLLTPGQWMSLAMIMVSGWFLYKHFNQKQE